MDLCERIMSTEVRVFAITNHNVFDLSQFREIEAGLMEGAQVWPGIEVDIIDGGVRGHLLVIVSPKLAEKFAATVETLTKGSTPDSFKINIDQLLAAFKVLNPLYIAHYRQKKPSLSDEVLNKLEAETKDSGCVLKEVTNSISAGIYISHGYSSIYGSDVQDWGSYAELSRELPDLRLPVDSFEHFCLLLKKDPTTINTVLDRKTSEELDLHPFDDGTVINIKAFNDINVIFGPKGTGKSCILEAVAKHYSEKGIEAYVYESASDRLDEIYDIKGKDLTINLSTFNINYCSDEIEALRNAGEMNVTALSKYIDYYTAKSTNQNAKKILLKDIDPEEEGVAKRDFNEFNDAARTTNAFVKFLRENSSVKKELMEEELKEVERILTGLQLRLDNREWSSYTNWKEICFLNSAISAFRKEVARKTGIPAKPTTTGFRDYAMNRVSIEANAAEIVKSVDTTIPVQIAHVGSLGPSKGELQFRTELKFQTGTITDSAFSSLSGIKKGSQKKFVKCIRTILKHAYSDDLFQHISNLNNVDDVESINTTYELLLFKREFALGGQPYSPSSGESSMVMLHKELGIDKDVYILDEPERSLGNEYISDVIVPLIKELARSGKKIFISTHDANIAVRTLPYCSVYRCHDKTGYNTYVGNPYTNNLVSLDNADDRINWKQVSMKTLEGGEQAFGERGQIYGKP